MGERAQQIGKTGTLVCGLHVIAYGDDPLRRLARLIIEKHHSALPNLTDVVVLLPSPQAGSRFRQLLLEAVAEHNHSALLGPCIETLPRWINQQSAAPRPVLSEQQRELMLVEALITHKFLYGEGNPWTLADSLLELFDDLGAAHIRLPESLDSFIDTLSMAYGSQNTGLQGSGLQNNDSLFGEAKLVHTLWQAWHQQMLENDVIDRHTDYIYKLAASQKSLADNLQFYIAGLTHISSAEAQWLAPLLTQQRAVLFIQASAVAGDTDYHPDVIAQNLQTALNLSAEYPATKMESARFFDTVYSNDETPLHERATSFAGNIQQSPVANTMSVFEANNAEKEAQAIDAQVRLWWQAGHRNIGIVTENRRLARRVRALLERSGIELEDAAGWALSTTSAAAAVERWLETVEEDFAHQPLLDFLKSPFLFPERDHDDLLSCVYRFEQGVVLKENIARGMSRYREHLRYRQNRLPADLAADFDDVHLLLDSIESAAEPLRTLISEKSHAPTTYLQALDKSIALLGLNASLNEDAAGQRILEELHEMQVASDNSDLRMNWSEFRAWLGRTLERFNFQPPAHSGQVQLMSLMQSSLSQFDALIIAGAESEYLPGKGNGSPFFNDGVRLALGLSSHTQQLSEKFHQFRCLLEASDNILLTRRKEQDGEEVITSPWLERLQSFHQLAYHTRLINEPLTELINQVDTQVTRIAEPLPQPVAANPAVSIDATLFPEHLSASGYQQLINCPYQFFAARCLQLEAPESIREMLQKADYGERVHLCLQAFHQDVKDLPGPFAASISEDNKTDAIHCLNDIATAVFARDLEDNFLHRGWLKRWQKMIPAYIEWQQGRQKQWRVQSTELNVTQEHNRITLRGRLDRVDTGTDVDSGAPILGIIDYKTGATPKEADVLSGESVQLPFYALLAAHITNATVTQVDYLSLDNTRASTPSVKTAGTLETEILDTLATAIGERLDLLVQQITTGTPMPAWGDETTCGYCQMSGLCRRETWEGNAKC